MKIERLQTILTKLVEQFPDAILEFADGYLLAELSEDPAQDQIDAIPTAEYEKYIASPKHTYRYLRIFGD